METYLLIILFIQANNAYIFPGFGLGLIISGAIRVHDDMLLAACKYININVITINENDRCGMTTMASYFLLYMDSGINEGN
jgi:malic enzyme